MSKHKYSSAALLFLIATVSIAILGSGADSGLWNDEQIDSTVTLTVPNNSVCIGNVCHNGWQVSISQNASINGSQICTADNGACPVGSGGGADGNNYTSAISFSGTNTKTLTLSRIGMSDLTAAFTDIVSNETSRVDALNTTKAAVGNCPGQVVQNITSTGVQCTDDQTGGGGSAGLVYLTTLSWSSESTTKSYTPSTSYDWFQVCVEMHKASGSTGNFGVRFNAVTTGYKQSYVFWSTLQNPNTVAFELGRDTSGSQNLGGCMVFPRLEINAQQSTLTGTIYSDDQVAWWGGRVDAGGEVTNVSFADFQGGASLTGNVTIWGMSR